MHVFDVDNLHDGNRAAPFHLESRDNFWQPKIKTTVTLTVYQHVKLRDTV